MASSPAPGIDVNRLHLMVDHVIGGFLPFHAGGGGR